MNIRLETPRCSVQTCITLEYTKWSLEMTALEGLILNGTKTFISPKSYDKKTTF